MRVLQVVQRPQRRGAEIFAAQLSAELRRQGHAVSTVYLYPFAGSGSLPLGPEDRLLEGLEGHPFERVPGLHPRLLRRLLAEIDRFRPDIVQANGARTVKYSAYARRLRPHGRWRLAYRNIGNPQDWMRSRFHEWFYRYTVMPRLDGVVGVSEVTLQRLQAHYRLSCAQVRIPCAADPAALRPSATRAELRAGFGVDGDAPVLLAIGSLSPEKRLDRLLRLAATLRTGHPQLRVWIVGEGPLREPLQQMATELQVQEMVRFWGVQSNIGDFLCAADLLALTSDTEGMPGVLLEAGYTATPVVATRVGGVAECVRDGETGILVDPADEGALAQAAVSLLADGERRRQMGEAARRWVAAHFTIERVACQYLSFYETLLAHERPSKDGAGKEAQGWANGHR